MRLRVHATRWLNDTDGVIAPLSAIALLLVIAVAGYAIDLGLIHHEARRVQAAADLAALSAAANLGRATETARQVVIDNRVSTEGLRIETGRYLARRDLPTGDRFSPGAIAPNAVRVAAQSSVDLPFTPVLGLARRRTVAAVATAQQSSFVAFSLGTGVIGLEGGMANAILGQLLGIRVNLSAVDHRGLTAARIDAFGYLNAIRARADLRGDTYAALLSQAVRVGDAMAALASVSPVARSALEGLARTAMTTNRQVTLGRLIDLGDFAEVAIGRGGEGPPLNPYGLIHGIAWLGSEQSQIALDLGLTLPGLTASRLVLSVGETSRSTGWITATSPHTTLFSAQIRALLTVSLEAPIALGAVRLPLYIEAGAATAKLVQQTCAPGARQVEVAVRPGLLTLAVADVSPAAIRVGATRPDLTRPAPLVALPLVTLTGKGETRLESPSAQGVVFTESDIAARRSRSVITRGMTGSATASLIGSLQVGINGLELVGAPLRPVLATALVGVTPVLDTLVDAILATAGLGVGRADVMVEGLRCGQAVLVQ